MSKNDGLDEIRSSIRRGDAERARQMLRTKLMSNPTAELYYLASQVARSDEQRRDFLDKTLALDPSHEAASHDLKAIERGENPDPFSAMDSTPGSDPAAPRPTPRGLFNEEPRRTPMTGGASAPFPGRSEVFASGDDVMSQHVLAGFGTRFIAYFIDTFLLFLVLLTTVLFFLPPPLVTMENIDDPQLIEDFNAWNNQIVVISLVVQTAYYTYFIARNNGQTLGKRVMKVRVVKLDGKDLTLVDGFVRGGIGYAVSSFLFFAGFFWALLDPRRQTWHDKLTNTVVVMAE